MAVFRSQLDNIMFTSSLTTLVINANNGESKIEFSIVKGSTTLFANSYTPDANGNVYIYDLHKLINSYIPDVYDSFTLKANTSSTSVTFIRCNTLVNIPASEFIQKYFLSPCLKARNTSRYRSEYVNILDLSGNDIPVKASAAYFLDGKLTTLDFDLETIQGFAHIDVSPSQFVMPSMGKLVYYIISAGDRQMKYNVVSHNPDVVGVKYRNTFNAWDTFYFTGLLATEFEHTRSTAVVGGRLVAYNIETVQSFKVNTGPLPFGSEVLPYELCRSMELHMLDLEGNSIGELVIIEDEIKSDNAPDSINDFIVTYRFADPFTTKINTPKSVKLFDDTFDGSFN